MPSPVMPPSAITVNSTITTASSMAPSHYHHLAHHKVNPGAAALGIPAFQEMDEWAPYRMAFLLLLVASSIALWASYKLRCESYGERDEVVYQPLGGPLQLREMDEWGGEWSSIEEEEEGDSADTSLLVDDLPNAGGGTK